MVTGHFQPWRFVLNAKTMKELFLCGPPRPPRAVRACGRPLCLVPQCVRPRRTINKTRYAGPPLSYQLTAPASSAPEAALVGGVGPQ